MRQKLKEIKDTGAFEGTSMTELTFPELETIGTRTFKKICLI
ncbi:hypothetical protein [Enterococcus rivorum]